MATAGTWETFPEYISVLEETPRIMDIGCQIPHGSLRFYVMGDRGADHEEVPTEEECAQMKAFTIEALNAGALGFTTARTVKHMAADGRVTPGYSAHDRELTSIAEGMREANAGVIETNLTDPTAREDLAIMRHMAEVAERPLTVLLLQIGGAPDLWRLLQQDIHDMNRDGMIVTGQVGCRPVGILMGWELSMNPFNYHPTYIALKHLPVTERIARLQNEPELRAKLLSEHQWDPNAAWRPTAGTPVPEEGETVQQAYFKLMDFALTRITELKSGSTGQPEYEPDLTKESMAARAIAAASGGDQRPDPYAIALEVLLKGDGQAHLLYPHENYAGGDLSVIKELLEDPYTISGLGDAGAHVG